MSFWRLPTSAFQLATVALGLLYPSSSVGTHYCVLDVNFRILFFNSTAKVRQFSEISSSFAFKAYDYYKDVAESSKKSELDELLHRPGDIPFCCSWLHGFLEGQIRRIDAQNLRKACFEQ